MEMPWALLSSLIESKSDAVQIARLSQTSYVTKLQHDTYTRQSEEQDNYWGREAERKGQSICPENVRRLKCSKVLRRPGRNES